MGVTAGDGRYLVGFFGAQVELNDGAGGGDLLPHGPVLGCEQDLLIGIVHGMEAEAGEAAFAEPVADVVGVIGILGVDEAVADEAVGEAGYGVGDVAVVPGGPTGLDEHGPVDAVGVHFGEELVGGAGFVGVGIPGGGGGADRVFGGIDLPDVNVGVYYHRVPLRVWIGACDSPLMFGRAAFALA